MARAIAQLWFQRNAGRNSGVSTLSRRRSACTRQSKRTWVPPADGRERPGAAAAQVTVDLGRDHSRRLEPRDARARAQVVGEPALEVLARHLSERGRPVGLDVQIHRAPPLRIGAAVRERRERRLRRRRHVPFVDEHVLARGRAQQPAARALFCTRQRRPRGVALVREVAHERGGGKRPRPAAGKDRAVRAHLRQPPQELRPCARPGGPARAPARSPAADALAMRGSGRHLAWSVPGPADATRPPTCSSSSPDRTSKRSDLPGVHVRLGEKAARAPGDDELEQLARRSAPRSSRTRPVRPAGQARAPLRARSWSSSRDANVDARACAAVPKADHPPLEPAANRVESSCDRNAWRRDCPAARGGRDHLALRRHVSWSRRPARKPAERSR